MEFPDLDDSSTEKKGGIKPLRKVLTLECWPYVRKYMPLCKHIIDILSHPLFVCWLVLNFFNLFPVGYSMCLHWDFSYSTATCNVQINPNEIMKARDRVYIPVSVAESRISKRFDTIPSGTLNPNADEIKYLQRLVIYKACSHLLTPIISLISCFWYFDMHVPFRVWVEYILYCYTNLSMLSAWWMLY